MRLLLLLLLCGGMTFTLVGQNICYDEQLKEGDAFCKKGDTRRAIINWQAAITECDLTPSQRRILEERIKNVASNCSIIVPPKRSIPDDMVRIQGGDFDMGGDF